MRPGSKIFFFTTSEWIQSGLSKIFFYDGMFSVGIAAAGTNHFKGSLYDFDCDSHDFLWQHGLKIPFEFGSRNRAQSLHTVERLNFQTLSQGMQPCP